MGECLKKSEVMSSLENFFYVL